MRGRAGDLTGQAVAAAGVRPRAWQRLCCPGRGPHRRGGPAGSAGRRPAAGLAAGVRCRWHELAPVRRGDFPAAGLLLSPIAAQRGQADRGRLVVSADQPAELREGLLDLAGGLPPDPAAGRSGDCHSRASPGPAVAAGPTAVVPLFAFDGGYDPIALADELCRENAQILVRIKGDRVFYADPPARAAGGRGRPRRHGARFDCKKPATWGPPQVQLAARDGAYGTVTVAAWAGLHPQLAARGRWAGRGQPPIVRGWVIRIDVEHLPRPTRAKKTLWLWWAGPPGMAPDLDLCWGAYLHRFDIGH